MATPSLKLFYFDINGLGARIRIAAAACGLPLEDHRFAARDEFFAMKTSGELRFGQVPMLLVDGKDQLVQSSAILRYICTLGGAHPTDPLLAACVDAGIAAESDAFEAYRCLRYRDRSALGHLDVAAVTAGEAALNGEVLPRHLGYIEKALATSTTGWIAGTAAPAACDFAWGTSLRDIREGVYGFLQRELLAPERLPAVNAFLDRFLSLPAAATYYAAHP